MARPISHFRCPDEANHRGRLRIRKTQGSRNGIELAIRSYILALAPCPGSRLARRTYIPKSIQQKSPQQLIPREQGKNQESIEALPQIRQTLSEINQQTPLALQIAIGVRYGSMPAAAAAEHGIDVASLLQAPCARGDPMDCDEAPRELRMECSSCYLPDHDEDAHFCHVEAGVVGVADGVGGWREKGVDAAAFSRGLMTNAFAEVAYVVPGTHVCPYTLLERAYQQTVASRTEGASTAVILSLAGRALRWAYVGDSGFAVFRDGKVVHRSKPQQLYFNCPFQLCSAAGGSQVSDAAVGEIPVKEGDVVAVASDGLFDNLFDADLERIVQMGTAQSFTPKNMADIMAGHAYDMARRSRRDSPFSVAASREQKGKSFSGGKKDDITVVVAFIMS